MSSPFERVVALQALDEGRYAAETDPAWNGTVAPNGGVLEALIVRAVQASGGAGLPPVRTVSTHYLDRPAPGPVEVEVTQLRGGRRVQVWSGRIVQDGRTMVAGTIVCSAAREQSVSLGAPMPDVPPAGEVPLLEGLPREGAPRVFQQLEIRPAIGALPFAGTEAISGGWLAIRGDTEPLDAARLTAICDLWWPAIFSTLRAPDAAPTLQLTVYLRDTACADHAPVLMRLLTETVREGHFEERAELWSADGRLLAHSVQLALLLPLAS